MKPIETIQPPFFRAKSSGSSPKTIGPQQKPSTPQKPRRALQEAAQLGIMWRCRVGRGGGRVGVHFPVGRLPEQRHGNPTSTTPEKGLNVASPD